MTLASYTDHRTEAVAREARARSYVYDPGPEGVPFTHPTPSALGVGSGVPPQAALGAPGTNVKVGTEPKGDRELPPSRWRRELTVIHTNLHHCSHRSYALYIGA